MEPRATIRCTVSWDCGREAPADAESQPDEMVAVVEVRLQTVSHQVPVLQVYHMIGPLVWLANGFQQCMAFQIIWSKSPYVNVGLFSGISFGSGQTGRSGAVEMMPRRLSPSVPKWEFIDQRVAFCYLNSMSQPVKLSDELVQEARAIGEIAKRSIAGQIEFWVTLGRTVELFLRGPELLRLLRVRKADNLALSKALSAAGTPEGNKMVAEFLGSQPFPHYEASLEAPGLLVRIEKNGKRTVGRFVQRRFVPVKDGKDL